MTTTERQTWEKESDVPIDWNRVRTLREAIERMSEPTDEIAVTLARIDERTKATSNSVALLAADVKTMQLENTRKFEALQAEHEKKFVTLDQFAPVQKIVYGLVGAILLSVIGALLTLIITKAK